MIFFRSPNQKLKVIHRVNHNFSYFCFLNLYICFFIVKVDNITKLDEDLKIFSHYFSLLVEFLGNGKVSLKGYISTLIFQGISE